MTCSGLWLCPRVLFIEHRDQDKPPNEASLPPALRTHLVSGEAHKVRTRRSERSPALPPVSGASGVCHPGASLLVFKTQGLDKMSVEVPPSLLPVTPSGPATMRR